MAREHVNIVKLRMLSYKPGETLRRRLYPNNPKDVCVLRSAERLAKPTDRSTLLCSLSW